MPSRNISRADVPMSYYHVYARGLNKMPIFMSEKDKAHFIALFERYLSNNVQTSKTGRVYPNYRDDLELLCYCLINNHFHLLVYQKNSKGLSNFMKSIMGAYSQYFNKKYQRSGPLFESRYKAVIVADESYLLHISRYIHLNPRSWKRFPYSSIRYFRSDNCPEWLHIGRVLNLFGNREAYMHFVEDYAEYKSELVTLKLQLANS